MNENETKSIPEDQKIETAALDEAALEEVAGGALVDGYEIDLTHLR